MERTIQLLSLLRQAKVSGELPRSISSFSQPRIAIANTKIKAAINAFVLFITKIVCSQGLLLRDMSSLPHQVILSSRFPIPEPLALALNFGTCLHRSPFLDARQRFGRLAHCAVHGLIVSIPVSPKSRMLRVTRAAPRERQMAAIRQSASPMGRPAWRRAEAMSA